MPKFVHGKELSELYYLQVVKKILEANFPTLGYAAARIGSGSDVLGYDSPRSTDHGWGPRLTLFLEDNDYEVLRERIDTVLRNELPTTFMGYSTNFSGTDDNGAPTSNVGKMVPVFTKGRVEHHGIEISTKKLFFQDVLGIDPQKEPSVVDWLSFTEQKLLSITNGKVYHDRISLMTIIEKFSYYPKDVWLYKMATQWMMIAEEEPFVARAAEAGDELGSRILTTRIVEELAQLCFLLEKTYMPYSKWLGTAFSKLKLGRELYPIFENVLNSSSIDERELGLSRAYEALAKAHNRLGITRQMETTVSRFFSRPYSIIHANNFSDEIRKQIKDPIIKNLPLFGGPDQFLKIPVMFDDRKLTRLLKSLYLSEK